MKKPSIFRWLCFLLVTLILLFFVARVFLFQAITMSSSSMEPTVNSGNIVIYTKYFDKSKLRKGDLVVVVMNTDQCSFTTLRRFIEYRDEGRSAWVVGDRTDGLKTFFDSKKVGGIPLTDIKLKALFVLPTHIIASSERALQVH
jgi:signal peptidase I